MIFGHFPQILKEQELAGLICVYNQGAAASLLLARSKDYHAKVSPNLKRLLPVSAIPAILILTLAIPGASQSKGSAVSSLFNSAPYRIGERLTYNVSFSNFPTAAHVELYVAARGTFFGREGIQIRAHVQTSGMVNVALYAINNDYTTYVDPETGLPYHSQEIVREAARTANNATELNRSADTSGAPPKLRTGEVPGTYDFVSALFRLRALPLSEGTSYSLNVRGESNEYRAQLKVDGREMIRTSVGTFNAVVTQLRVPDNSEANSYHLKIYFSDDDRHVPVLFTARQSSGDIRAELAGSQLPATSPPPTVAGPPSSPPGVPRPPASPDDGALSGLPFKVGEQLNYRIFAGNMPEPVATASYQVRARSRYFDHDGLMFTLNAKTTGLAQLLFSANDQIVSYVDQRTLLPFRTELNLVEGNHRENSTLILSQDDGKVTTATGQRLDMPVGTHDYLSVLYAIRTFNLVPPKRLAVSILVNNRPKTLFITSLGRETIELGSQKILAIQISLTTDDPESDKFVLRGWISDDQRRLPLRLTAATEIGPLRADLAIIPVTRQ